MKRRHRRVADTTVGLFYFLIFVQNLSQCVYVRVRASVCTPLRTLVFVSRPVSATADLFLFHCRKIRPREHPEFTAVTSPPMFFFPLHNRAAPSRAEPARHGSAGARVLFPPQKQYRATDVMHS